MMKKNIWSNVYYRLNDPVMIRFAILYTMKYVEFPISSMDLKHVMLDASRVDYFDLCEMIDTLKKENHIKEVIRDGINKFSLTDSGIETIQMFEKNVLYSVRRNIRQSADKFFKEEFEKHSVKSSLTPSDIDTFYLDVELKDGNSKLLSMSLFAGSREKAEKMREKFNSNPTEFFSYILKFLSDK